MSREGWICPICKAGVSPDEKTCPCVQTTTHFYYPYPPWVYPPASPWWEYRPYEIAYGGTAWGGSEL